MSRRAAGFVLGFALALVVGGGAWWWLSSRPERPARGGTAAEASGPEEPLEFALYFPADGGMLRAQPRDLPVTEAPKDRIRKIVEALLGGPAEGSEGLYPPFSEGVTLGSVQLGEDGTTYVDLRQADHPDPPSSGSTEEMQRVYSLVNSIVLNVPQARRVVLLWNGAQLLTFSDHLDTSRPLLPNRTLVATP